MNKCLLLETQESYPLLHAFVDQFTPRNKYLIGMYNVHSIFFKAETQVCISH